MTDAVPPQAFGARLATAMAERGPLCAGIDPHPGLLAAWGLPDDASGLERFARTAVAALAERVAAIKPQSAFFERHGSAGVAVLERVLADCRAARVLTILDVKRGDIGSTMAAYADAYAGPTSPLAADAVTASPYLGFESLRPLIDLAARHGRGVFVLARTSNPEGAEVQRAAADGRTVAQSILDRIALCNAGAQPQGSVGAVIGATLGPEAAELALAGVNGPLLAPGLGAQGAQPADVARVFAPARRHVLPAASRGILQHGPDPSRLSAAADGLVEQLRNSLG